jgi:hypothetical protein
MALPPSTAEIIDSLEHYDDVISWINDILQTSDAPSQPGTELNDLDQQITHLLATLDIASEDTSTQLEQIIDDVSRSIPRLTYDLHFLKDNAISLQGSLSKVHQISKDVVPQDTTEALNHLRLLDTAKSRMESAREVLREAESWSSLELEVTSLLAERNYGKAAERLSEANRSMVVFQNTPDYEPRRTLMVNLQNQLEASLSSALVSAINAQDVAACRNYFSIFSRIQRESEFRNYYNASRRTSVVAIWNNASLLDCDSDSSSSAETPSQTFARFLPTFYGNFLSLLNVERVSIPAIFPDPALSLSAFISSTLSSLQPTFSQRLSSLVIRYGDAALPALLSSLRATEEFAAGVEKVMEKLKYAGSTQGNSDTETTQLVNPRTHARRRSARMSISLRPGHMTSASATYAAAGSLLADGIEWDHELFKPFLDFQVDYGTLERRLLEHALREVVDHTPKEKDADRARLLRERAIDVFAAAEESLSRCTLFTHGYGSVGLVQALDSFFQSFIDIWTADVSLATSQSTSHPQSSISDDDLFDMDYSAQDWSDFQHSLHLLSSARAVYERISVFEAKLRSTLIQTAIRFRLARKNPITSTIAPSRGENQLLEQSSLNSSDLHSLLTNIEAETHSRDSFVLLASTAVLRHNTAPSSEPLLVEARRAVFTFASTCQHSLQKTISSPLRKHLASYASSTLWNAPGDPKSNRITTANELRMPTFSLSPSDIVQRVAEGLLNLPRLFEVYADDDALAFSLHTLPNTNAETHTSPPEQPLPDAQSQPTHARRTSWSASKPTPTDPDGVSSAWLSSLGHTLLEYLTTEILPSIASLSPTGAAQLASDLEYLSNIVRVLNVEYPELDKWKEFCEMDDEEGKRKFIEEDSMDRVLLNVGRLRGWNST